MKEYKPNFYCYNSEARKNKVCSKCGKCGRRFRKGILIDNNNSEFMRHVDSFKERDK